MKPGRLSSLRLLMLCFLVFPVISCEMAGELISYAEQTSREVFLNPDVNLKAKNYAAADYLISRAGGFIDYDDPLAVQPLYLRGAPEITSGLGKTISRQIGARLAELGYSVDFSAVDKARKDITDSRAISGPSVEAAFILSGTYAPENSDIEVELRMRETATGRLVGAFDYRMPADDEIKALSAPQPRIFKIKP